MDWKRRSDQPQARFESESDEGTSFEEENFIDASTYERKQARRPNASAEHARPEQAAAVDPVFAERGRIRRERQSSSFNTQRLTPLAGRSGGRRNLPLVIGGIALILLLLVASLWFLNRDGTPTAGSSPTPTPSRAASSTVPNVGIITGTGTLTGTGVLTGTPSLGSGGVITGTGTLPSATPAASATGVFVVSGTGTDGLFLRQGASTSATIITTLPEGTRVQATGQTQNDGTRTWRQVRTDSGEGWVASEYLQPAQ